MTQQQQVEVFAADEQDYRPLDTSRWAELASKVVMAEGVRGPAELSLMFVDAEAIAALNLRFRDKEGPTDVLAFPLDDEEERDEPPPPPFRPGTSPRLSGSGFPAVGPPRLLGDIVICPEVAAANAETHAGSFEDELALLIVHGILHLRGYDHEVEQEAAEMEQREARLLADCYGRTTAARSLEPDEGSDAGKPERRA